MQRQWSWQTNSKTTLEIKCLGLLWSWCLVHYSVMKEVKRQGTICYQIKVFSLFPRLNRSSTKISSWNWEPVYWVACLTCRILSLGCLLGSSLPILSLRPWALPPLGGEWPAHSSLRWSKSNLWSCSPPASCGCGHDLGISVFERQMSEKNFSLISLTRRGSFPEGLIHYRHSSLWFCFLLCFSHQIHGHVQLLDRILCTHLLCSLYLWALLTFPCFILNPLFLNYLFYHFALDVGTFWCFLKVSEENSGVQMYLYLHNLFILIIFEEAVQFTQFKIQKVWNNVQC